MKGISDIKKTKILWILFWIMIGLISLNFLSAFGGLNLPSFVLEIQKYFPAVIILVFMAFTLTYGRALFFLILAMGVGFAAETIGTNYGIFFGGDYTYLNYKLLIFGVPPAVIFYWAIFIFIGYSISNSFLYWAHRRKPRKRSKNIGLLAMLILLDGILVVAIDIFMDPLSVYAGHWAWADPGPYFGVPLGNFLGWFLVTIIVTGIFRLFEYIKPQVQHKIKKSVFIIPVIIYSLICFQYIIMALNDDLPSVLLIGIFAMIPIIIVNVLLFLIWRKHAT